MKKSLRRCNNKVTRFAQTIERLFKYGCGCPAINISFFIFHNNNNSALCTLHYIRSIHKRTLSIILALILALSALSFASFAEETDLAESASAVPGRIGYTSGSITGTTGVGTKADPIIVDTFDELKKALEYPLDGLCSQRRRRVQLRRLQGSRHTDEQHDADRQSFRCGAC
ncbi:MAG: hypothetical protein IJH32_07910 [Ruminococcus sp.]|nr:hypothetical protein [Ruminococcus sp.]